MKKVIFCLAAAYSLVSAVSLSEAQIRQFEQRCEAGDASICGDLGIAYYMGDNGFTKDYEKAAKFFAKACDGNNYKTCSNLGFMYSNGQGPGITIRPRSYTSRLATAETFLVAKTSGLCILRARA